MKFTGYSILDFSIKHVHSNSQLQVSANKTPNWLNFVESVFMHLMWNSWTSLVIYMNLDIQPRLCEVSSQRSLAGPSYIVRDNELRKRIVFALSVLLQSRSGRITVPKWCGVLCLQPHSLFRLPFSPFFTLYFGLFCVLFSWQFCLFFPNFLKEFWESYFLHHSLFLGDSVCCQWIRSK